MFSGLLIGYNKVFIKLIYLSFNNAGGCKKKPSLSPFVIDKRKKENKMTH